MKRELCAALDGAASAGTSARLAPRLVAAALVAELAGADRVRLSLREDLAPIGTAELRDLRRAARCLELRMSPGPASLKIALEVRPERVLLATEPPPGRAGLPLDVAAWSASLPGTLRVLREAGIGAALAIAPTLDAVKAARGVDAPAVELSTAALVDLPPRERAEAFVALGDAARLAAKLRMSAGVGGGLELETLARALEAAPSLEWASTGRGLTERALLVGLDRAVRDWRERI